jgi:hypothetical protein
MEINTSYKYINSVMELMMIIIITYINLIN